MRVASAAVLATVVLTTSATAALLDVEPVGTTSDPEPQTDSTSSNATSHGEIGIQRHRCSAMWSQNWDDFKYSCVWSHAMEYHYYYNHFFMRWDGSVVKECDCDKGIWNYNPWGSRWTFSYVDLIACYSRDGKLVGEVKHFFDAHNC